MQHKSGSLCLSLSLSLRTYTTPPPHNLEPIRPRQKDGERREKRTEKPKESKHLGNGVLFISIHKEGGRFFWFFWLEF